METNPIAMCELLVGLGDVDVVGIEDVDDAPLAVHVRTRTARPSCPGCDGGVWAKDDAEVELADLPVFGRSVRLVWH